MNTTYKPVDREFLEMLAAAKARGMTWMRLAEMTKKPVVELEVIPWREPKAWAKACKYAEKLMHHEMLSEILTQLRVQMNDNVNNARSKSQIANSVVRVIQLQHTLRTPKKPKKTKLRPLAEPTPTPTVNEPVIAPSPAMIAPKQPATTPPTTVATIFLLLVGALMGSQAMPLKASETPATVTMVDQHNVVAVAEPEAPTTTTLGDWQNDQQPDTSVSTQSSTYTPHRLLKNPHVHAQTSEKQAKDDGRIATCGNDIRLGLSG